MRVSESKGACCPAIFAAVYKALTLIGVSPGCDRTGRSHESTGALPASRTARLRPVPGIVNPPKPPLQAGLFPPQSSRNPAAMKGIM